jgi:hypothetical protein
MDAGRLFSETQLARVRAVCREAPYVAALYAFAPERRGDCNLAALFVEAPDWPRRLNLEMGLARALDMEGVELINLKRMPLVFRFDVLNRGDPIYVGQPEALAIFIEETIARYSAFYPLLEALYWTVETKPLAEDQLER